MDETIRYVSRNAIDIEKWNQCIDESPNMQIYGYSFYLDYMAKHWDALIWGDYELVMPLTWNKKFGFSYLYQPAFTASLGVFGKNITDEKIFHFIHSIPATFRLVEMDLNYGNNVSNPTEAFKLRINYVLPLNKSYEEIFNAYRSTAKRNCKKAQQLNCRYSAAISIDDVIVLAGKQEGNGTNLRNDDYRRFKNLFTFLHQKKQAMACGVFTGTNELVASCVYFFSNKRAYYILVGNHPNGKTMGASHYLIDRFICEHAGKNLLLDFEGSDNRNLAFFYSSFGAQIENYPALHYNKLPWWVNLFKKIT